MQQDVRYQPLDEERVVTHDLDANHAVRQIADGGKGERQSTTWDMGGDGMLYETPRTKLTVNSSAALAPPTYHMMLEVLHKK